MVWVSDKTTTERGYGWKWQKLRQRILRRDNGLCRVCKSEGRYIPATDVDHIQPKAKGGTDEPRNLQSLCKRHHDEKTAMDSGARRRVAVDINGYPL